MNELTRDINALAKEIFQMNVEKGFWEDYQQILYNDPSWLNNTNPLYSAIKKAYIGQKLALVHSEISEALEADRKDLMDDKLPHRSGLEVELADGVIRILDLAGCLGLDLGGAIEEKLEYNKNRPYKHGKSY